MSPYRVILRFDADAPAVTGDWAEWETARRCYSTFVGRYGSSAGVTIQLVEHPETAGLVRKTWPPPD